jgi:hypothetical protein
MSTRMSLCQKAGPGRLALSALAEAAGHRLTDQDTQKYGRRLKTKRPRHGLVTRAEARTQGAVTPHARDPPY